jgi:NADPH:quinone reductase-like Zn-dependent oxidoreductase
MKAIIYRRYGGPEVLEYVEMDEPKLGQNSVLVRIEAASLNPADIALQAGMGAMSMDAWFPVIPGWDIAGVVEEVGAGVSEFKRGDTVLGYVRQEILHFGGYAEQIAVPVEMLVPLPAGFDFVTAAAVPLAGLTAWRAVIEILDPAAGTTMLLHGAAGGVGAIAAQLAISRGVRVIGAASPQNREYLRSLGIEPITYGDRMGEEALQLAPTGVDVELDCAGRVSLTTTGAWRTAHTQIASIADGGLGITTIFARPNRVALATLAEMVKKGELSITIAGTFPLEEAAEAQRALARPHSPGKFVLQI